MVVGGKLSLFHIYYPLMILTIRRLEEIEEETLRQEFMQFGYDFVRVNIPATSS